MGSLLAGVLVIRNRFAYIYTDDDEVALRLGRFFNSEEEAPNITPDLNLV
jgi:hypothetical protein